MKSGIFAVALAFCLLPAALHAQAPAAPSMRDRLMPSGAALMLTAPVQETRASRSAAQPAVAASGPAVAYMIVGGALFAGGLIAGGDAGTVMVLAGAGIGAYGLYLYFR